MQTDFNIVPTPEELAAMNRDLRFHPSTVENPSTLSPSQITAYNQDGYLKGIRVYSQEEITTIRTYFDDLLAKTLAAGGDSYSISTAHLSHAPVYDMLTHPPIVAIVKDILGDNVIGWGSHFFCKMPHDGKAVAWHQDASYWPMTPSKTATVWLAIDDADLENACMNFIAGSHRHGHIQFRASEQDESNVLNQTVENADQYGEIILDELSAGELSIHSDLLLHGSDANTSNRRRCGLTLRYCTPDVVAGSNWHLKGVMVSGQDSTGHWANPPRP